MMIMALLFKCVSLFTRVAYASRPTQLSSSKVYLLYSILN